MSGLVGTDQANTGKVVSINEWYSMEENTLSLETHRLTERDTTEIINSLKTWDEENMTMIEKNCCYNGNENVHV